MSGSQNSGIQSTSSAEFHYLLEHFKVNIHVTRCHKCSGSGVIRDSIMAENCPGFGVALASLTGWVWQLVLPCWPLLASDPHGKPLSNKQKTVCDAKGTPSHISSDADGLH